jgi:hypothetical protein
VTALKVFAALAATLAVTFAATYLAARWLLRLLTDTETEVALGPLTED